MLGFEALGTFALSQFRSSVSALVLAPSLVSDADTIPAPVALTTTVLLPGLVTDAEVISAAILGRVLAPGPISDADLISATRILAGPRILLASKVSDDDAVFAASLLPVFVLKPSLLPANDSIPAATLARLLQAAFVLDAEAIQRPLISLFLRPQALVDSDTVPGADVGWRLYADLAADSETIFVPVEAQAFADLRPELWAEEETPDGYPFFIASVVGGLPIPKPPGILTGTLGVPRHLTGSLSRPRALTGSIRTMRTLTGNLRRKP